MLLIDVQAFKRSFNKKKFAWYKAVCTVCSSLCRVSNNIWIFFNFFYSKLICSRHGKSFCLRDCSIKHVDYLKKVSQHSIVIHVYRGVHDFCSDHTTYSIYVSKCVRENVSYEANEQKVYMVNLYWSTVLIVIARETCRLCEKRKYWDERTRWVNKFSSLFRNRTLWRKSWNR